MLPIRGLYEVAIRVKHLPRAEAFYRDMLGLDVGIRDKRRSGPAEPSRSARA
jgi:catechol 2,3-dioxygenase-like lactoylglutathione lyase family enzyme